MQSADIMGIKVKLSSFSNYDIQEYQQEMKQTWLSVMSLLWVVSWLSKSDKSMMIFRKCKDGM